MYVAQAERAALSDLLDELGPQAPTLCEGWLTDDLLTHLLIRERRPDAALASMIRPLRAHSRRVRTGYERLPWSERVELLRAGPPRWVPFGIPAVDKRVNALEYVVHHEDVRRAQPGWEPRAPEPERYRTIEAFLRRFGKLLFRSAPSTVRLDTGSGMSFVVHASDKPGGVTIVGSADELAMFAFGREDHARVELVGSPDDVAALRAAKRGF